MQTSFHYLFVRRKFATFQILSIEEGDNSSREPVNKEGVRVIRILYRGLYYGNVRFMCIILQKLIDVYYVLDSIYIYNVFISGVL